ncbi:MAG: amidohydrolase [Chloroflexi bacterium]|nr:amidohydrolase [Chloroflexota bacterium]
MPEFEIIDAHTHTYPTQEIGRRAKGNAGDGNDLSGTVDDLEAAMAAGGISQAVMLCLQPYADMRDAALARLPDGLDGPARAKAEAEVEETLVGRQQRRNQWTCEVARERPSLIPFLTIDPSMPADAICSEIDERVRNEGARGLKLHASLGRFYPYDPRLFPAYDLVQEMALPVVFHGGSFFEGRDEYSRPRNFKEVARRFPRLSFVLAHLGQGFVDESLEIAALYPQVAFDCSAIISGVGSPDGVGADEFVSLVRDLGVDRVQYGSDYPFFDPPRGAEVLLGLPFTNDEKRLICADNARRALRLG